MDSGPARLAEAKDHVRHLLRSGQYPGALTLADHLLTEFPLDADLRVLVAMLLAKVGLVDEAASVQRSLARYWIESGRPLRALVAADALAQMDRGSPDLVAAVARAYAQGSPKLAPFAARPAPSDPDAPVRSLPPADTLPFDKLCLRAHAHALDLSALGPPPSQVHRVPLLSELDEGALRAVLASTRVHHCAPGTLVLRQGEPGSSLYLVAAGELRVFLTADGVERELARVHENCLLGEMALITDQPRAATAAVVREAEVIELHRSALETAARELPGLRASLDRFARERLIKNLLGTSPLFTPFTKDQQAELLRRFEGVEVDPGVAIIRQGEEGRGLHVVLSGELEVVAKDPISEDDVQLARLRTGDIFGEMSLITRQATTATVRSTSRCVLLFLARIYVERLGAAFPEVQRYFAGVAERRARDNGLRLGSALPEEPVDLDFTDSFLI